MVIAQKDYDKIIQYVQQELLKQLMPMIYSNQYPVEGVAKATLLSLPALCTLDNMLAATTEKKEKAKKVEVNPIYKEAWEQFWNLWPGTKSVPDTKFKSGAKMKSNEIGMYQKWVAAIETGKIGMEAMYKAANSYLQWAYEDSKKMGRNELQYRSGMDPWLNQEQYLIWMDVALPMKQVIKEKVYENSTDQ